MLEFIDCAFENNNNDVSKKIRRSWNEPQIEI
jgi:hypothetical protein